MPIIIIGGGVVGTTLAFNLARAGADVTLLEGNEIAGGATSASFSMHIATRKTPRHHFQLAIDGGHEHFCLAEQLGALTAETSWIHPAPFYEWAASPHEEHLIEERVQRLKSWGYNVKWIGSAELRELEPELRTGAAQRVAMYPDVVWYDAPLLARQAAAAAERLGARIVTGERVTAIKRLEDHVEVSVSSGATHLGDSVVIAAGASARAVAALADCDLPVDGVPGFVITTDPVPESLLNGIVLNTEINMRPAPGGRIVYHSYAVEGRLPADLADSPDHPLAAQITELAATLLPKLAGIPRSSARVGVRPVPADGLPIVGWLDEGHSVYAIAAHSAVNFAPLLAKLASAEITSGISPAYLEPFHPDRLSLSDPNAGDADESTREMYRIFAESRR